MAAPLVLGRRVGRPSRVSGGEILSVAARVYLALGGSLLAWVVATSVLLGWRPLVVTSASMQPAISAGDVVMMDRNVEGVEVGSVVAYRSAAGGRQTIHRVVAREDGGGFVTRGDANRAADPTVPAAQVDGVGRLVVPIVGLPVTWVEGRRYGPLAAVIAVTCLALVVAIRPSVAGRAR